MCRSHTTVRMNEFKLHQRTEVDDTLLNKCAELFSGHYGVWGEGGRGIPGQPVKLTAQRLRQQCLFNDNCFVVTAMDGAGTLKGHAMGVRFRCDGIAGDVVWLSQIVVSSAHRNQGIATQLCRVACADCAACGLATSHPYTIKALERAAGRRVDVNRIRAHGQQIVQASGVPYISSAPICLSNGRCVIDTQYFVSHEDVNEIARSLPAWPLGILQDGEEFLAICFTISAQFSAVSA